MKNNSVDAVNNPNISINTSTCVEVKEEPDANERKRRERKGVIYQVLMGLCANVSIIGPAMGFGFSAVTLGPLTSPTGDMQLDVDQANWIATAAALGTPVGCLLTSVTMRRGRRVSLLVTALLSMAGWITIYLSINYEQILVGRVISGVATGMASVPATVYVAEIAGPKLRSTMVTWTSISIALGVLIVYIFGYVFKDNWRMVSLMCTLFPLLSIALTLLVTPESPLWLRDQNRTNEALEILKKFRGVPKDDAPPPEVLYELKPRPQKKKQNLFKHLMKRNAMMPFAIMLSYFFFQQFSGIFVVIYYAVDIIASSGVQLDPYLGAVLIGITRFIGSLLVASVSRKYGRRIPSIFSGIGMGIFMGGLSLYLFLENKGYVIADSGVIPTVCVLMYIFTSTLGYLVIPFAMVGEVFPAKVKDILSGLTTSIAYVFSSVTVKTYPNMLESMGKDGVFLFFAVISFIGVVFVTMYLPETKGKTLHEIEDMFSKKKNTFELQPTETVVGPKDTSVGLLVN
ncbi:facilitated trehalose transporter Tret1-2 homolog [Odontomachus brunneus]|uniref:facilitated trehalose transporter Tret1-2 homolog n=1 Tax=Odontomachus brunneus TaxID=486640 RepID=UPI0013F1A023|nr:facilitated trehalose transporter Tret1-2 homolog [Odontomachus brunneus]